MTPLSTRASSGGWDNLLVHPFNLSHTHNLSSSLYASPFSINLSSHCLPVFECEYMSSRFKFQTTITEKTSVTGHPFTLLPSPSQTQMNVCEYYVELSNKRLFPPSPLPVFSLSSTKRLYLLVTQVPQQNACVRKISELLLTLLECINCLSLGSSTRLWSDCWTVGSAPWCE